MTNPQSEGETDPKRPDSWDQFPVHHPTEGILSSLHHPNSEGLGDSICFQVSQSSLWFWRFRGAKGNRSSGHNAKQDFTLLSSPLRLTKNGISQFNFLLTNSGLIFHTPPPTHACLPELSSIPDLGGTGSGDHWEPWQECMNPCQTVQVSQPTAPKH